MKPGVTVPLGVVVALLGLLLLLQGCWEVRAEIGERYIRRITAAGLPSSNSTDAAKVRQKKFQVRGEENCTKGGSCNNPTTPAPPSTSTGKTVASFQSDDVLQGRLHAEVLRYLTTTRSPYDIGYDSYFGSDDFNDSTIRAPKKSSFVDKRQLGAESTNFDVPLTTPRIKLFDDFHARMTEGIRQNLQEMDEQRFREVTPGYGDKGMDGHQTALIPERLPSPGDPTEKTDEKVALEFVSNFSIVYNDSILNNSVKRDVVVENGSHIDFDWSRVYTKIEPDLNRTTYYVLNDTNSTINPDYESVSTDSRNDKHSSQTTTTDGHSKVGEVSLESLGSSERSSPHLTTVAEQNATENINTGTPDDKNSTTSESTTDRSILRSHEPRNCSSDTENVTVTIDGPITCVISNETKLAPIDIEMKYTNEDTITSSSSGDITVDDLKFNTVSPISEEGNINRGSRMVVSGRGQQNSTNGLEQSSQTPLSLSSENNYNSDDAIKKPKARHNLLSNGTSNSELQVKSSTASADIGEESSQTTADARNIQNNTNPTSGYGFTVGQEDSSTVGYTSSSRGRTLTYRRPYTTASSNAEDASVQSSSSVRNSTRSPSVNTEAVRSRMTSKRRPHTSTEASIALVSSSNLTTESNVIVRGLPVFARRTPLPNGTDNNEGNDIIYVRNNVYTPAKRNRGSARYGSQRSDASGGVTNASSPFSKLSTPVAWALVSRKGPDGETRVLRQDNSTSDAQVRRWYPTRGRRPWNSEEQGSTTIASDVENVEPTLTSPKSTKLRPIIRTSGVLSQKLTQPSSMQENRLSSVQVDAPTTERYSETTEEPTTEDEVSSTPHQVMIDTKDLTTSDSGYEKTGTIIPVTITSSDMSTSLYTGREDISYKSYFFPTSEANTAVTQTTTDDAFRLSTESIDSTTENLESTNLESENAGTEGSFFDRLSTEDDNLLSTPAADENTVTSTTERPFQSTTRENDNQNDDEESINLEMSHGSVGNSGDVDENKQGGNNTFEKVPEEDVIRSGDESRTEVISPEGAYNQGDISGSNLEGQNKNSEANFQVDDTESSGKLSVISGDGNEPYPIHEEPQKGGTPETATLDDKSGTYTAEEDFSSTGSYEIQTITSNADDVETFSTPRSDQTNVWSSSTGAVEWDADSTTLPSAYNVPFYLILSVNASWSDFCEHLDEFKQSVTKLMRSNGRLIETYQVILPNSDETRCLGATTDLSPSIEVEMYLVDEASYFDHQLTYDFYWFWREFGLSDLPFNINTVQTAEQTSDGGSEDIGGGMIAAITISCIGAACLILLAVLWLVMRKRQESFTYGQRCTPVSLDAYSLDSVSVCGSVRRKGGVRNSKRSYGNAGFDDPSSPTHPMGFAGLANFILNRESLEEEYASIPQVTANVDELPEGADTKNRYSNVIPLPETRVQLSPREGDPLSEYINANFVHGPKNASKYYIACQAPLASTVTDFWRMIWEQQSKVILMLTDLVENGVEKCADYLPPSEVLDCHRLFGDFQITLKKREVKELYIISTLQLKNLETNSWREVMHLWYVSWPTQGVPDDVSSVIAFLLEARPYMRGGPCVVHCSPGTGRTGAVIACDLCIRDFETLRIVDVPRCVARLRRDRAGAVQTRDQYVFIYHVINLYGTKLTGGALDSI
ncbi:uncharacterized protein LOC110838077 isoform X3 [Zootermopsis nevadensis]|uniref:uncharacterized protein LOC110838077 isoform X3 n=1 Tax=Zootermopsis nevadensis TaxID=136037 RepID=UPI000B8EC424|nr:uncharacterized protein LOC110838077 isoform X3 [Zootermopsis nevadensis]